jgi:hypothetical protein
MFSHGPRAVGNRIQPVMHAFCGIKVDGIWRADTTLRSACLTLGQNVQTSCIRCVPMLLRFALSGGYFATACPNGSDLLHHYSS